MKCRHLVFFVFYDLVQFIKNTRKTRITDYGEAICRTNMAATELVSHIMLSHCFMVSWGILSHCIIILHINKHNSKLVTNVVCNHLSLVDLDMMFVQQTSTKDRKRWLCCSKDHHC